MFNVGAGELLVILLIALIVLGPDKLPDTARKIGNVMGELRRMDVLWFLLHDSIHHRGQFSIYLRMVDGKVPSIYGPSADEPWN